MIKFVRSLFGLNGSTSGRKVIGSHTDGSFDLQEVTFIKDSSNRLAALVALQKKYKGTLHEEKIKKVHEATKKIHWFLVSKKRLHELELFHIRNTDNFLSTFTLIVDVHKRHQENNFNLADTEPQKPLPKEPAPAKEPEVQVPIKTVEPSRGAGKKGELFDIVEKVKQRSKQSSVIYALEPGTEVPSLIIPEVSINTVAKVFYSLENAPGKQIANEISFVSTQQEKDAFQLFVSDRLGMKDIYYVGNARVKVSDTKGVISEETAPVFYLRNYLYAITLQDFRMYPVKITRNKP
jgi:hypothetical protein